MSGRCDVCGKQPGFGKTVSRLGKNALKRRVRSRVSRMFKPNIQTVHIMVGGGRQRLQACTSCIRKGTLQRAS